MRTTETSACPTNHRLFGVHDADVDEHVAACPRCRALRRLGYERTLTASSCAGIEPVLAARALGPLAEADERALLDHLEGCEACVALARDLDEAGVGGALV